MPDPEAPGKIIERTLNVQFEPQSREEAIAAQEHYNTLTSQREREAHEVKQLDVCKNWDDVVDGDGGAVAFTPENITRALNVTWFRQGVYQGYSESLRGDEARLGN